MGKHYTDLLSHRRWWLQTAFLDAVVFALVLSPLPTPIQASTDNYLLASGFRIGKPDGRTGRQSGVIAVEVNLKMPRKRGFMGAPVINENVAAQLDMNPMKFIFGVVPGQPAKLIVPVTNISDFPVTMKDISVEDGSGALRVGDGHQGMIVLAPAEKYDIHLSLTTSSGEGKARVRIVAAKAGARKDEVKFVDISYSRKRSQDAIYNH
jgi:hypothetical protein